VMAAAASALLQVVLELLLLLQVVWLPQVV
jgi:hypothetical protein